jgi:hypothetical protein
MRLLKLTGSAAAILCVGSLAAASPAVAAGCPLIKSSSIAAATGLPHVLVTAPALVKNHTSGEEKIVCRIAAFSGTPPANAAQARQKLGSGTLINGVIDNWSEAEAASEPQQWQEKGFEEVLSRIYSANHALAKANKGFNFDPPTYGAEISRGWGYMKAGATSTTGLWYSSHSHSIVTIVLDTGTVKGGLHDQESLAKTVVALGIG